MNRALYRFFLLLALTTVAACTPQKLYKANDFSFYEDANRKYYTGSLTEDFKKHYQMEIHPVIVLVKTDNIENLKYDAQRRYVAAVEGAEERQIIYVVYSADGSYRDGYHIKKTDLPDFFKSTDDRFHVYLINRNNEVLVESSQPVPTEEIEEAFPKMKGW